MSEETQNIKTDIESTRESMTAKMEAIESKIMGTVDDVKTSVNDTVEQVKQTFDISQQVNERPWTIFGASVLAGLVLGSLGGSDEGDYSSYGRKDYRYSPGSDASRSTRSSTGQGGEFRYYSEPSSYQPSSSQSEYRYSPGGQSGQSYGGQSNQSDSSSQSGLAGQASGLMSTLSDQFGDELNVIKSAAITTVGNMIRDLIQQNLPQFGEQYDRYRRQYGMADSGSAMGGSSSSSMGSSSMGGSSSTSGGSSSMSGNYGSGSSYTGTTGGSSQSESGPLSGGSTSGARGYGSEGQGSSVAGSSYSSGSERSVGIDSPTSYDPSKGDKGSNGI